MVEKEGFKKTLLRRIAKLLNTELPVEYINPCEQIHSLKDDPETAYVWRMRGDVSNSQMRDIISELHSRFIKINGRDPYSLHLIVNDLEDIKEMDGDTLHNVIIPWIKTSKNRK